jgi:phospholipid/cholesterol/gamma-HCH transport system permease protein
VRLILRPKTWKKQARNNSATSGFAPVDGRAAEPYSGKVNEGFSNDTVTFSAVGRESLHWAYAHYMGRGLFRFLAAAKRLMAFTLVTLGVFITKLRVAPAVTFPSIRVELTRSGTRLLPMFLFMSAALGLAVIGQAVSWLGKLGANSYLGTILVVVVVRELGPLLAALLVLARAGARTAIELATMRALGEVEALEALGIDPVHYLVVPRVIGMALGVFALTTYFILGVLGFGYLFAFLNGVPLRPGEYTAQIAGAMTGLDFALVSIKSCLFGTLIGVITCYQGLAQPLRLEEVSRASVNAVVQSVIACVLLDALFIVVYLCV